MSWTMRDAERERAIIENIERGEDRSAAILAASYLEDRLTLAVKARFVRNAKVHAKLFNAYGPLASFTTKIDLAYLMKIISEPTQNSLHLIKKVRNLFAHRLDINTFDDNIIHGFCNKLLFRPNAIKSLMEQNDKDGASVGPFAFVLNPLSELSDTPRNSYMSTIKIILMFMEIETQFALAKSGETIKTLVVEPGRRDSTRTLTS